MRRGLIETRWEGSFIRVYFPKRSYRPQIKVWLTSAEAEALARNLSLRLDERQQTANVERAVPDVLRGLTGGES